MHNLRRLGSVEFVWIKRAAPLEQFVVSLMIRIGQGFQIFPVTPHAADIFGRARPLAFKTQWKLLARFCLRTTFK